MASLFNLLNLGASAYSEVNGITNLLGLNRGGTIPGNSDFNINQFRTHFSNHLETSKSDKFDVHIGIPTAIAQGVNMQDLSLQCEISELPGRDINMIEFRHYGFTKRIPHINQYGTISFTFICAGDLFEKQMFDRWMDYMIPANTGIATYPQDSTGSFVYASQIAINQRDNLNNIAYTVNLFNAMPVGISPMSQNWQDDSTHRLSVTFAYEKWTSAATTGGGIQTNAPIATNNIRTNPVNNYTNYTNYGTAALSLLR